MAQFNKLVQIGFTHQQAKHIGNGFVTPESYGAVADGVYDCTEAINAAVQSLATTGGAVIFSQGTYLISGPIAGVSNVSFFGCGPGSIIRSNFTQLQGESLLNLVGTQTTATTLTADVDIGDKDITVNSTTGFSAGDYIFIAQNDNWAEMRRVKEVTDATHLELYEPVSFFWLNGDDVYQGDWVHNVTVRDLKFIGTEVSSEDPADRYEDHAVNCQMAHHIIVSHCYFENIGSRAIIFIDRVSESIATCNHVVKCYDRAIESHHLTSGNILSNNTVLGGLIGVVGHGIGTIITGNTCKGQYGIDAGGTIRGSGIAAGDMFYGLVSGNTCLGAEREGMAIGSDVYHTLISNNLIAFSKRDGLTFNGGQCAIINNSFHENGTQTDDSCISLVANGSDIYISGNQFFARTDDSITTRAIYSAYDHSNLVIGENGFFNFPGTKAVFTGSVDFAGTWIGEEEAVRKVYAASTTWDPPDIATGTYTTKDVTVTGCDYGDKVNVAFSIQITDGAFMIGQILSADTVRVYLYNFTGANYNLGSGTVSVQCWRDRFGINGLAG